MAFLNRLGRVSRRGQWRFRHIFRVADATGRIDQTDAGLFRFGTAEAALTLWRRAPVQRCVAEAPLLSATRSAGTLFVYDPGFIEAVFARGWSRDIPPGTYDLRVAVAEGDDEVVILDQPVELF